jgi:peptide/nickel transport system permease protein
MSGEVWSRRRLIGLGCLAAAAMFALLGPSLSGVDPFAQDLSRSLAPPGADYMLGADVLGRDLLSRLAHAAQLSLGLAVLSAASAAVPGVLLGVLAAWAGGWTERALAMLADAAVSIPGLLLVLLFATLAPGAKWALYVGVALVLWVEYFRVCRAAARPVLAGDAVQASRLLGFNRLYLFRRHVWPALAPLLTTLFALSVAQAVLAIAALGFISVGVRPPTPELGLMMTEALPHYREAPWLLLAPVVVLMLVVTGMMLLAVDREEA